MSDELRRIEDKIDLRFRDFQKFLTGISNKITANSTEILNCKHEKDGLKTKINGTSGLMTRVGNLETINKTTNKVKSGILKNSLEIVIAIGVIVSIILGIYNLKG